MFNILEKRCKAKIRFKFLFFFFVLPFFLPKLGHCQILNNIAVDFTRIITKDSSNEVVKGIIYYQADKRTILNVTEPLYQWMIFEDSIMLIYYPNEEKAFRFRSKNPFSLPFFQAFVGVIRNDFGLSEAGFSLAKSEIKGETLLSYWEPPKQLKKLFSNAIIGQTKDKLVFVEMQDPKGKKMMKTTYRNHFQYGKTFFPLEITSVIYQKGSSTVEKIVYANPQFNVPLPQEVVNFEIPANVEIKEMEW